MNVVRSGPCARTIQDPAPAGRGRRDVRKINHFRFDSLQSLPSFVLLTHLDSLLLAEEGSET